MTKSGKKTADFAEDTDGEKKSAPSVLSAVKSPAPTGRNMPAQGNALGHASQNTSSPDGAKEGAWPVVPLSDVVEINPRSGDDKLADDAMASFIPMKCVEEESGRFAPLGDRKVAEVRKGGCD